MEDADHIDTEIESEIEQVLEDNNDSQLSHDEGNEHAQQQQNVQPEVPTAEKSVPLQSHIRMRKRAQEAEDKARWLQEQLNSQQQRMMSQPAVEPEDDSRKYESATKAELDQAQAMTQEQTLRLVEEKLWVKQNPDKFELVMDRLEDFLKQRPNLRHAISSSSNRYEEAYTLMEALTPKQQAQLQPTKKTATQPKVAPGSPASVPKGAALNEAVDVMTMTDKEYRAWVQERKNAARRR